MAQKPRGIGVGSILKPSRQRRRAYFGQNCWCQAAVSMISGQERLRILETQRSCLNWSTSFFVAKFVCLSVLRTSVLSQFGAFGMTPKATQSSSMSQARRTETVSGFVIWPRQSRKATSQALGHRTRPKSSSPTRECRPISNLRLKSRCERKCKTLVTGWTERLTRSGRRWQAWRSITELRLEGAERGWTGRRTGSGNRAIKSRSWSSVYKSAMQEKWLKSEKEINDVWLITISIINDYFKLLSKRATFRYRSSLYINAFGVQATSNPRFSALGV